MLEGLTPPERITPCAVRTVREKLDEADRTIFDRAVLDVDSWPHKTLANALCERGVMISEKPIRKHRTGECSCR
jgi:hypothetical protein